MQDDLVDDSVAADNDIVQDRSLTAHKKQPSKDKEKEKAEEAVDKDKAGAEERDEDNAEDTHFSLARRAKKATAGGSGEEEGRLEGLTDEEVDQLLSKASEESIFYSLACRFEDTKAEADQTFIVHGESLLLHCLNDPLLAWSPSPVGGQYLHVIYAMESELARLSEGGRQCRVLWLDCFTDVLCAGRTDLLVLAHIVRRHTGQQCGVLQDVFADWWSDEFRQFLERVDPAFLIVGDAHSHAYERGGGGGEVMDVSVLMRGLTLSLLSHNFRCVRMNEMRAGANGIVAFQYQMPVEYQHKLRQQPIIPSLSPVPAQQRKRLQDAFTSAQSSSTLPWSKAVSSLPSLSLTSPNTRLALTVYAVSQLLIAKSADADSVELAKLLILQAVLLGALPLSSRALLDEKLTDQVNSPPAVLSSLLPTYFDSIASVLLTASADASISNEPTLLDLFDLRLLLALRTHIRSASSIGLTRQQADVLNQCWSLAAGAVTGVSKDWLPLYGVKELAPEVDVETAEEEEARKEQAAQASEQSQQQQQQQQRQEQRAAPTATSAAATEEKVTKPKKTVKIKEAWDDEDEEEEEQEEKEEEEGKEVKQQPAKTAKPAAAPRQGTSGGDWDDEDAPDVEQKDVEDDWEALAEDDVPTTQQTTSTTATKPTPSATSPSSTSPLVQPIAIIQHPLLDTLTSEVNASLASASALRPLAPPSLPPTAITAAAELDVAFLGEEIKEEGDILRDKKAMRQHQRQINFMTKYSKSLGGGKIVQREVIVKDKKKDDSDKGDKVDKDKDDSKKGGKAGKPGAGGGKKGGASGGGKAVKLSVAEQIKAEGLARQRQKEAEKVTRSIAFAANLRDLPSRIESLDAASEAYSDEVVVPALMQLLVWQLTWWKEVKSDKAHGGSMMEAVKTWTIVHDVYRRFKQHLKLPELQSLQRSLILLGFNDTAARLVSDYVASMGGAAIGSEKELRVDPRTVQGAKDYTVNMSAARFQMEHGGPYMLRNVASSADERVDFYPDAWQARLLDVVDARHSALLVAPTSSGKTFISYYCMKQTLKDNAAALRTKDRRVIVYVAPNKALVNQVSGDIYRRFGDVFGVMTSDWQYRVLTCDVLITVPTSLEALLLDPARSEWVATIRYVIFDEVHLIGSEEGLIWERCIQICQHAPFLALSATVGNAESFHDWLARCQAYHQRPVHLIQHTQRWADLEKYAYVPQKQAPIMNAPNASFQFADMHGYVSALSQQPQLASVIRVHPCAAITNVADLQEAHSFPPELAFSPKDSLSLYDAMQAAVSKLPASSPLVASLNALDPERYFTSLTINKSDAMEYERAIKNQLSTFIQADQAPLVASVLSSLSTDLQSRLSSLHSLFPSPDDAYDVAYQMRHFLPLLVELNAREHLPAIVFCHDQLLCNQLVIHVVEELERLQDEKRREERTDESERARLREREKQAKALRRLRDKQKNRAEQEELQREGASTTTAAVEEEEDVYDVDVRFSFLKQGESMDMTEMEWWISRMLWKTGWKRSHPLVRMLYRGIGVHHGALVKPYRDAVETLFRAKHLKVVVATQTLALGINMPARSVVFCGDSKLLTPLQYRQMSGRAGRRGFDLVGHVVFFAIPPRKMFRLLKSPLLSLRGQYPVNTSFALRTLLFTQGVTNQQLPFSLFPSLVQQSFFAHSHPSPHISQQIVYHFRYACQLLFQQSALNERGRAHGLAGFIAHLHASEPSNLILAMLLLDGQLQTISNRFKLDKNGVARQLLFILAHLFQRVPMPQYLAATAEQGKTAGEAAAESAETNGVRPAEGAGAEKFSFILDPLPSEVQKVVDTYNRMTVDWAVQYLAAFATLVLSKKSKRSSSSQPTIATPATSSQQPAAPVEPQTATMSANAVSEKDREKDGKKGSKAGQGKKGGKEKEKPANANAAPSSTDESVSSPTSVASTLVVPPLPDVTQPAPVDSSLPPVYVDPFVLPRSGLAFPHAFNSPAASLAHALTHPSTPSPVVRSPFVSLSGATDTFNEADELLRSVRNGAIIESSGLPTLDTSLPLNSYIVDFYRHGDIDALIGENGIPRNRVFDLLKRFDLMLTGLIRALGLLGLGEASLLWRAFQHMQAQYHELFAKLALQH